MQNPFDNLLFFLFMALVVVAPLPSGGNIPLAWSAYAATVGLFLALHALTGLARGQAPVVPLRWIALPAILFMMVCLWAIIQSLGVTPSAWHNPLWSAASDAFGEPLRGAISINPFETRVSLMRLLTYGGVFWLALQFGRDARRAELMLHVIGLAIVLYALYGLVLWSFGSELVSWHNQRAGDGAVTSTFVNRNNFATFAGMGSVIFLGLLVRQTSRMISHRSGDRFRHRLERFLSGFSGAAGLYLVGMLVTLGAVFLTRSRAGFLATMAALAILLVLSLAISHMQGARRQAREKAGTGERAVNKVVMVGIVIGIVVAAFHMSGDHMTRRILDGGISVSGRSDAWLRVIAAIRDYPLLGTGYGSFEDIFPLYRDETISAYGRWDKAHNSWLEVMLELGLPAAILLFTAMGWLILRCLRGAVSRQRGGHIPLIGFTVSALVSFHALFDFSLQIPGLAVVYAAILGFGVAQSWSSRRPHG